MLPEPCGLIYYTPNFNHNSQHYGGNLQVQHILKPSHEKEKRNILTI